MEGDDVEVKILTVDAESQKMGLSLKATQPEPEKPAAKSDKDGAPENQRPMAVPRRDGPLKGGRDKGAGACPPYCPLQHGWYPNQPPRRGS